MNNFILYIFYIELQCSKKWPRKPYDDKKLLTIHQRLVNALLSKKIRQSVYISEKLTVATNFWKKANLAF